MVKVPSMWMAKVKSLFKKQQKQKQKQKPQSVIKLTKPLTAQKKKDIERRFTWAKQLFTVSIANAEKLLRLARKHSSMNVAAAETLLGIHMSLQDALAAQKSAWLMSPSWVGASGPSNLPNWPLAPLTRYTLSDANRRSRRVQHLTWNNNNTKSPFSPDVMKTIDDAAVFYMTLVSKFAPKSKWARAVYDNTTPISHPLPPNKASPKTIGSLRPHTAKNLKDATQRAKNITARLYRGQSGVGQNGRKAVNALRKSILESTHISPAYFEAEDALRNLEKMLALLGLKRDTFSTLSK